MSQIAVEVIAQSLNQETGDRITTFKLRYPRMIHAHVLTHRVFSRNSASSRAVPVKKMLDRLTEESFVPQHWVANCKGMSPSTVVDQEKARAAQAIWARHKAHSIADSRELSHLGVHKELANRITEPHQLIEVVLTATNFVNFQIVRVDGGAQNLISDLALEMTLARSQFPERVLKPGQWHLPFVTDLELKSLSLYQQIMISIARCARVSYFLVDGKTSNWEKDYALAQRLIKHHHMSPAEHAAVALPDKLIVGNFCGFMQYRKFLIEETFDDLAAVPVVNTVQAQALVRYHFPDLNSLFN